MGVSDAAGAAGHLAELVGGQEAAPAEGVAHDDALGGEVDAGGEGGGGAQGVDDLARVRGLHADAGLLVQARVVHGDARLHAAPRGLGHARRGQGLAQAGPRVQRVLQVGPVRGPGGGRGAGEVRVGGRAARVHADGAGAAVAEVGAARGAEEGGDGGGGLVAAAAGLEEDEGLAAVGDGVLHEAGQRRVGRRVRRRLDGGGAAPAGVEDGAADRDARDQGPRALVGGMVRGAEPGGELGRVGERRAQAHHLDADGLRVLGAGRRRVRWRGGDVAAQRLLGGEE